MRTCSMCYSNLQIPKLGLQSPSLGLTSLGRRATITTISQPLLECFRSIQYSDAPAKILDNQFLKHFVKVFGLDLETTGLSRKEGRIVEIAVRDLHGGKNSCFQTLVNPEQHVPNSHIHGITTDMVTHSGVPRMAELIPILVEYIKSRQVPGGHVILAAHNARCFDVPFLLKEFSCCSFDVPPDWLFLDTLALARELRKLHGSKALPKISLQGLREFYRIPLKGSNHRAMSDVNVLSSILPNMTFDLKLGVDDLLQRTFKASACNITRIRT
ncbi:hypothetical protein PRUPE_1G126500 [Prunus persica]|uniref:Exonuclease domain-containing protein n=1 Tax=Prunus persica TaxID=3760 RepID=M5XJJ7_PRUPE|nr:exonuclease DPD1, chloroplastic/mitochondrial [Prunus persica]ONI28147.1 hypothetical protein PRUPE_1G126500 [Prunus persica]ONI28148.1 hypothetical protein PRUPE_1G126500 [Prunus persica]